MPPLDSATINAILQKQGMPNITENLNRIAQFAAVAPDMLQQYLGQGTDAAMAGGGTNGVIDRSIASTADPRLAQLAGPNPYSATLDPNTGMTNIGPGLVKGPAEPRTGNGVPSGRVTVGQPQKAAPPTGSPSRQGNYGPGPTPPVNPLDPHVTATGGEGSGWLFELLVPILGAAGAAAVARGSTNVLQNQRGPYAPPPGMTPTPMGPQQPQAAGRGAGAGGVNQPATSRASGVPQTPTASPPTSRVGSVPPSGPQYGPTAPSPAPGPGQTYEDIARMNAEVQAENEAVRLREQMKAQAKPPATPPSATSKKPPRVTVPGRP